MRICVFFCNSGDAELRRIINSLVYEAQVQKHVHRYIEMRGIAIESHWNKSFILEQEQNESFLLKLEPNEIFVSELTWRFLHNH